MTLEENNELNNHNSNSQNVALHDNKPPFLNVQYEEKTTGFWMRFWAFIIDQLIVIALIGIVVYPIFHLMNWSLSDSNAFAPISIISSIFYFGYFVLMTKYLQQTLGKMIFGLKVQKVNGDKLDWSTVLFREIIGRFISNTIPIFYLIVIFMPKNNSLADYISDTVVIHENVYVKSKKSREEKTFSNTLTTSL